MKANESLSLVPSAVAPAIRAMPARAAIRPYSNRGDGALVGPKGFDCGMKFAHHELQESEVRET
jgi:hypothetical protein